MLGISLIYVGDYKTVPTEHAMFVSVTVYEY